MNSAAVKQVSVFVADQVSKQDVQASSTQFCSMILEVLFWPWLLNLSKYSSASWQAKTCSVTKEFPRTNILNLQTAPGEFNSLFN